MSDDYQTIKTTANNRKELVRAISAYTGEKARYIGPPTFAYTVGPYFIYCDCSITAASCHCSKDFLSFSFRAGISGSTNTAGSISHCTLGRKHLKNLVFMLHSKQYLLNRAIGSNCFSISDKLITDLQTVQPIQQDSFLKIFQIHSTHCQGISCKDSVLILQFPASNDAAQNQAFTDLAAAMVEKPGKVSASLQLHINRKMKNIIFACGSSSSDYPALPTKPPEVCSYLISKAIPLFAHRKKPTPFMQSKSCNAPCRKGRQS